MPGSQSSWGSLRVPAMKRKGIISEEEMLNYAERGKDMQCLRPERSLMLLHTEKEPEQVRRWNASPLVPAAATTGQCSHGSSGSCSGRGSACCSLEPYFKCKKAWKPLKYGSSPSHRAARRTNQFMSLRHLDLLTENREKPKNVFA